MMRLLWLFFLLLAATPAPAAESAPVTSTRATATLVSASDSVRPGAPAQVALRLAMAPGWHSYWQNPGDAGAPAELAWTLPDGASAGPIAWPTPAVMREGPLVTYGFTGDLLLPVAITPPAAGALDIALEATWLVCAKICVPEHGRFSLHLSPGDGAPSAQAALFAAAAARSPVPNPFAATVAPDGTLGLAGAGLSPSLVAGAQFIPADSGSIVDAAPQTLAVGDGAMTLALSRGPDFHPGAALHGVLLLRDPQGVARALDIAAQPGVVAAVEAGWPVWELLGAALLGGLLLNLMPCVFPVLAMKALALARLSGADRAAVRAHALSYTAGVLLAFLALGAALLALRSGGSLAGWGFQFQSPALVAGMAWLLFAIGLNLLGVFEIGGGLAGLGNGLAQRGGHAGSFFTGLLAVVVATPCTAPFMGAAVAAALAGPPPLALGVFAALGLGLAAPYALLALRPSLAGWLPRPGAWMVTLRRVLALPMFAACAWLLWVVSLQAGMLGVLAAVAGAALLGFAAWVYGAGRRALPALLAVACAAALLPALAVAPPPAAAAARAETLPSEAFSADRLAALQAEGRPVFVNLTAAWCVSCLVNERVALSRDAVRDAFAAGHVAYLKGDWTRGDPAISRFLRQQGRDGVPLYLYYPPHAGPQTLPQILTEATVLDALHRAGG